MYSTSLFTGENYDGLKKCIAINFLCTDLFDYPEMHSTYKLHRTGQWELLTDHLEIPFIELNKLDDYNIPKENKLLVEWASFLSLGSEEEMERLKDRKDLPEEIRKAVEELEELRKDPELQWAALNKELFIRDYMHGLTYAKREGVKEGRIEGLKEGREDGLKEGHHEKALEIARRLLKTGMAAEEVANITGLNLNELDHLK